MKRLLKYTALLVLAATVWSAAGFAQSTAGKAITPTTEIDTKEFPLWVKDLRRAEIIAFGSFPFTMFLATFAMDTWRMADHGWDTKYAPWPLKTAGAINMTTVEHERTMVIAAAASVTLALTDFAIVKIRRYKQEKKARRLPAGSPIIIERTDIHPRTEETEAEDQPPQAEASPESSPAEAGSLP